MSKEADPLETESVHIVIDYWGGPIEGVADYRGNPHYFKALFDEEKDDWSNTFLLTPLDTETYGWFLEANRIWLRWKRAIKTGQTTEESFPTLPEDRERRAELANLITQKLRTLNSASIEILGTFDPDDLTKLTSDRQWRVSWFESVVDK